VLHVGAAPARWWYLPTDATHFWLLPASSDYIIISIIPIASLCNNRIAWWMGSGDVRRVVVEGSAPGMDHMSGP
jgi:hypothetical protein